MVRPPGPRARPASRSRSRRGVLFGLLGPNGAGKTTLFSVAAGFLKATAGTIEILGMDVARGQRAARPRLRCCPRTRRSRARVPVIEQLVTFRRLNGFDARRGARARRSGARARGPRRGDEARGARAVARHGETRRARSGVPGQPRGRVPRRATSGLDLATASAIRAVHPPDGREPTVIMSSHNLAEIQEMCTHCAVLHKGQVAAVGSMGRIPGTRHLLRVKFSRAGRTELAASASRAIPGRDDHDPGGGHGGSNRLVSLARRRAGRVRREVARPIL